MVAGALLGDLSALKDARGSNGASAQDCAAGEKKEEKAIVGLSDKGWGGRASE